MRPRAPIPAEDLDGALRPFGEATMLPASAYTAPEVLAWELRHLFAGSWTCLGRAEESPAAGVTQRAVLAGDVPVLLTPEGAFANTCRHRGHELLAEGGTSARDLVVCPYHAWAYRLDGTLRGAPGFKVSGHDLPPLPMEVWHGWVFV